MSCANQISIKPRSDWATEEPNWTRPGVKNQGMGEPQRITVHHTGLLPSGDSEAQIIDRIREDHMYSGFTSNGEDNSGDIGYHFIVGQGKSNVNVWEGRSILKEGSHVQDQNEQNIGVVILGDFARENPTEAQLDTLVKLLADLCEEYKIPYTFIERHMDLIETNCPGDYLANEDNWNTILMRVDCDIGCR